MSDPKVASEAVSDPKVASEAVSDPKVASEAVSDSKVASEEVSDPKVASEAVSDPKVANRAVSDPKIVSMWSGPRNMSTALMYSWRQRHDTVVFDEPFYGRFLVDHDPGHPGRDEIVAAMETDYETIMDTIAASGDRPVRYIKNIAHHLRSVPADDLLGRCTNVILIRDPAPVVASLSVRLGDKVEADWTGFGDLIRVLDFELAAGRTPIVVDSATIVADPESALRDLSDRLGLAWDPAMLSWPAGPKPEDGVWAKYWYDKVHQSTGFAPPTERGAIELNEAQTAVFDACVDSYRRLASYAGLA